MAISQRPSFWVYSPIAPWLPPVSMSSQTVVAASGPWPAGRVVKQAWLTQAWLGRQLLAGHRRHAAEQPVGGHDDQARIVHRHAHHQRVVGRVGGREEAAVVDLLPVVAGGLVAVVAVGDEDRLGAHHGRELRDHGHVGDRPEAMDHAQMVGGHQRRLVGHGGVQQVLGLALGVGIEAEDRAHLGLGHHGEHEPIDLGGRQGFFVREDLALAEPREPLAAEEPAADVLRAGGVELLVIDVDGRLALERSACPGRSHCL